MKAVVFHGIGDIRLDDVKEPKIKEANDAIVALTASAICGTDLHMRQLSIYSRAELLQRDFRLGLKTDFRRYARGHSPFLVLGPNFGEVQLPSNRQTRFRAAERQTHGHATVFLLAHLPTVLPDHPHRMLPLFHQSGIIDHPGDDGALLLHPREGVLPHRFQKIFVPPGCVSHDMV